MRPLLVALMSLLFVNGAATADPSTWRGQVYDWLTGFNKERVLTELSIYRLNVHEQSKREAEASFGDIEFDIEFRRQLYAQRSPWLVWRFRLGRGQVTLTKVNDGLIVRASDDVGAPLKFWGERSELSLDFDLDQLRGYWDSDREMLRELQIDVEDAVIKRQHHRLVEAESLTLETVAEPLDGAGFDQDLRLALSNIQWTPRDAQFGIASLILVVESNDNDLAAQTDWFEHFQLIDKADEDVALPSMASLWRRLTLSLDIEDTKIGVADGLNALRLGAISVEGNLDQGADEDALDMSLVFAGRDVGLQEVFQRETYDARDLTPKAWHLPLSLEGVPGDALSALIVQLAAGPELRLEDADPLTSFWRALMAAGTGVRIDGLSIDGALLSLSGEAELRFDASGQLGILGEASFRLQGIEAAEEALKTSTNAELKRAFPVLLIGLKGLGKPVVEAGAIVYRYDLTFPQSGAASLNNLPLVPLLNSLE